MLGETLCDNGFRRGLKERLVVMAAAMAFNMASLGFLTVLAQVISDINMRPFLRKVQLVTRSSG